MTMFKHTALATVLLATIGLTACQTTQSIEDEIPLETTPIQVLEQAPPALNTEAPVATESKGKLATLKEKFHEMKSDVTTEAAKDPEPTARCTQRNPGEFQHYGDCQFQRIKNMEANK